KNTRVQPEDILLNITGGSIGRCCIFPAELERANVNQHVSIIRVTKSVFLPEYMHYYWLSKLGYMSIHLYQTGGNREGMTADAIKNSPIPLMPIKEQKEIVDYLDSKCLEMDSLIEKKERFLAELETYKKSLIFEYVTGKKEVPA
ncbi:restriction endonuclease subunit S, partial [bacterium]|nr:restriction endonuclease subunit S [bacterium]